MSYRLVAGICEALGLKFYVGPPRTSVPAAIAPPGIPAEEPVFAPAVDPDFAAVVAALADEYQANNDRGRRSLIARFWALFPELRCGKAGREVRRLARRRGSALPEWKRRQPLGAHPVEVLEFASAAGDGGVSDLVPRAGVEHLLAPTLRPGDVVIMDNLSAHKVAGVRKAIEARGAELVYLPTYSPDLNLIEQLFAKLKALLRRAAACTIDTLWVGPSARCSRASSHAAITG